MDGGGGRRDEELSQSEGTCMQRKLKYLLISGSATRQTPPQASRAAGPARAPFRPVKTLAMASSAKAAGVPADGAGAGAGGRTAATSAARAQRIASGAVRVCAACSPRDRVPMAWVCAAACRRCRRLCHLVDHAPAPHLHFIYFFCDVVVRAGSLRVWVPAHGRGLLFLI
jgi:hypothetical protein